MREGIRSNIFVITVSKDGLQYPFPPKIKRALSLGLKKNTTIWYL